MKLKSYLMRQKMMTKVLISIFPIALLSIFMYGWRVLVLFAIVSIFGCLTEYFINRMIQGEKAKVTESVFVTCALFTLSLPATIPFWVAIVGIIFGVLFGKMIFGGFSRNIFNPALVGRAFIYIGFPTYMTMQWAQPEVSFPGGFAKFAPAADAISSSTPMIDIASGEAAPSLGTMFSGFHAGSMGETSILLILVGAIYLVATKTASWKIMVSTIVSAAATTGIFSLFTDNAMPIAPAMLTGGLFFAAIFMATDPVTAPKTDLARVIIGALIGFCTVVIRTFGLFTEGAMFAVLIANAFTPLVEREIREIKANKKAKAEEAKA